MQEMTSYELTCWRAFFTALAEREQAGEPRPAVKDDEDDAADEDDEVRERDQLSTVALMAFARHHTDEGG